jgi:hypothetical protein
VRKELVDVIVVPFREASVGRSVADAFIQGDRRAEGQKRAEVFHDLGDMRIGNVGVHGVLIRPFVDDEERVWIVDLLVKVVVDPAFPSADQAAVGVPAAADGADQFM